MRCGSGASRSLADDGAYDIKYEDGDEEHGVKADHVRLATLKGAAGASTSAPVADTAASPLGVPTSTWQCMKCLTMNDAGVERCKVVKCNVPFARFGLLQGGEGGRRGRKAVTAKTAGTSPSSPDVATHPGPPALPIGTGRPSASMGAPAPRKVASAKAAARPAPMAPPAAPAAVPRDPAVQAAMMAAMQSMHGVPNAPAQPLAASGPLPPPTAMAQVMANPLSGPPPAVPMAVAWPLNGAPLAGGLEATAEMREAAARMAAQMAAAQMAAAQMANTAHPSQLGAPINADMLERAAQLAAQMAGPTPAQPPPPGGAQPVGPWSAAAKAGAIKARPVVPVTEAVAAVAAPLSRPIGEPLVTAQMMGATATAMSQQAFGNVPLSQQGAVNVSQQAFGNVPLSQQAPPQPMAMDVTDGDARRSQQETEALALSHCNSSLKVPSLDVTAGIDHLCVHPSSAASSPDIGTLDYRSCAAAGGAPASTSAAGTAPPPSAPPAAPMTAAAALAAHDPKGLQRPSPKRMLSDKSLLGALPEAKHVRDDEEEEDGAAAMPIG